MQWSWLKVLIVSFLFCEGTASDGVKNFEMFFLTLDKDLTDFNHRIAELAWDALMNPSNINKQVELEDIAGERLRFINRKCKQMGAMNDELLDTQRRAYELMCSGVKFDDPLEQRELLETSSQIQYIYTNTKICIPNSLDICSNAINLWNFTYVQSGDDLRKLSFNREGEIIFLDAKDNQIQLKCYSGEPQLEKLMDNDYSAVTPKNTLDCKRNVDVINYWIWEVWRQSIGPNIRELYPKLIKTMNNGAQKADFSNIGMMWQHEMEIDEVEDLMRDIWTEIQPFYNMLHAFVKSILEKNFKSIDKRNQNIPAHFLGWNANWYHLLKDYIEPTIFSDKWNIDESLRGRKWTSSDVVKKIEDFYTSLGLTRMPRDFWDKSYISNDINMSCHGTAANMFKDDDYRVAVCGYKRLYDLYVITHEMGHVEQYMMSQNKLAPFRTGNTVIQETIGDSIFLGFITPMHLNRLKLIDDSMLFPTTQIPSTSDLHQLLIMALMKVPEIPFGYVFESFRYDLFAERIDMENSNDYFWELTRKIQRIEPPNVDINRHQLFDVAAKFHFAANVPYARYFFANILQYQIFRGMCEATVYGKVKGNETLSMPLHKCDIYGSRRAGKLLKKALKNGSEATFKTILKDLTGMDKISAAALLEYYEPLIEWLKNYLSVYNIVY
ncbi:hypothetical protein ACKWTF_001382 [Chironomus riparius]